MWVYMVKRRLESINRVQKEDGLRLSYVSPIFSKSLKCHVMVRNRYRWSCHSRRSFSCLLQWEAEWDQTTLLYLWQGILCSIQALCYWQHYLLLEEFVLFSDHKALKYIFSQKKLNARHGHWIEFFQEYTLTLRHIARVKNKVIDALSYHIFVLTKMSKEVIGFEKLKTEY